MTIVCSLPHNLRHTLPSFTADKLRSAHVQRPQIARNRHIQTRISWNISAIRGKKFKYSFHTFQDFILKKLITGFSSPLSVLKQLLLEKITEAPLTSRDFSSPSQQQSVSPLGQWILNPRTSRLIQPSGNAWRKRRSCCFKNNLDCSCVLISLQVCFKALWSTKLTWAMWLAVYKL